MNNPCISKYKVGDKVKVKSLAWYNKNKDCRGNVVEIGAADVFTQEMSQYCGKTFTITSSINGKYFFTTIFQNNIGWNWCDFMLEKTKEQLELEF